MNIKKNAFIGKLSESHCVLTPAVKTAVEKLKIELKTGNDPLLRTRDGKYLTPTFHFPNWFLIFYFCSCGACIKTRHPSTASCDLAHCLPPALYLFLPIGDTIEAFCERLSTSTPFLETLYLKQEMINPQRSKKHRGLF